MHMMLRQVLAAVSRCWHHHDQPGGQGLVEYALLLIMVAVIMVALMVILGPGLSDIYANIIAQI